LLAAFAASIDFPGGAGSAADVAALAAAEYAAASATSPASLWAEHEAAWAALHVSGVDVAPASDDPGDVARALDIATHANASRYFLLSSARSDAFAGISPGGIASCSYNGAVFMDQDWWMQPPLVLLAPDIAAALLQYRFLSIPVMKNLARVFGFDAFGRCQFCDCINCRLRFCCPLGFDAGHIFGIQGDAAFKISLGVARYHFQRNEFCTTSGR
jgi:hypothetical protein